MNPQGRTNRFIRRGKNRAAELVDKRTARCRSLSLRSSAYRRLLSLRLFKPLTGSAHAPPIKGIRADVGSQINMINLNDNEIYDALQKIKDGLNKYCLIQNNFWKCNVKEDLLFQTKFNGFYRIRRNAVWRNHLLKGDVVPIFPLTA